ncbi:MAG: hypothetical protein ABI210_12840 [Abditibacteriaceae bacterium]
MRKFFVWLFAIPETERTLGNVVAWWELRRFPYNIIVGSVSFVSLVIFFVSITSAHVLGPGEDPVEPLALIISPIIINICYTVGWFAESILWLIWPRKRHVWGPLLFKIGLAFSLFMVTFPALFWGGFRLLQILGFQK